MLSYYEKLLEYWRAGNTVDANKYFKQWTKQGLLTPEEIEKLGTIIPDSGQCLETEVEDNPEVRFIFYEALKKTKKWNDKTLSEKLRISMGDILCIRNKKKPKSKKAGQKIVLEWLKSYKKEVS